MRWLLDATGIDVPNELDDPFDINLLVIVKRPGIASFEELVSRGPTIAGRGSSVPKCSPTFAPVGRCRSSTGVSAHIGFTARCLPRFAAVRRTRAWLNRFLRGPHAKKSGASKIQHKECDHKIV